MINTTNKILTTHSGSIPRPKLLGELLVCQEQEQSFDQNELIRQVDEAVAEVVKRQLECGIDIGNDGEQSRIGFQTYVAQCMSGFGGSSTRRPLMDFLKFPEFAHQHIAGMPEAHARVSDAPQAIDEVVYRDYSKVTADCALLARVVDGESESFRQSFLTAPSPGIIATTMHNAYYDSYEDYLSALSEQIHKEYAYIVDQGYLLQVDAPDLAMERTMEYQDLDENEFLQFVELHVNAINAALGDIPPAKVRLHVCWGNYSGPHIGDIALEKILPIVYQARVGAFNIGFGNPRHQHELAVLKQLPLPDSVTLVAGVIDTTTPYVEHPEVVANRICEAVEVVGDTSRVIAGTDCGFGTFVGFGEVTRDVVWAKLAALSAGANIASQRLGL